LSEVGKRDTCTFAPMPSARASTAPAGHSFEKPTFDPGGRFGWIGSYTGNGQARRRLDQALLDPFAHAQPVHTEPFSESL
jgi:hypothetical protein